MNLPEIGVINKHMIALIGSKDEGIQKKGTHHSGACLKEKQREKPPINDDLRTTKLGEKNRKGEMEKPLSP